MKAGPIKRSLELTDYVSVVIIYFEVIFSICQKFPVYLGRFSLCPCIHGFVSKPKCSVHNSLHCEMEMCITH